MKKREIIHLIFLISLFSISFVSSTSVSENSVSTSSREYMTNTTCESDIDCAMTGLAPPFCSEGKSCLSSLISTCVSYQESKYCKVTSATTCLPCSSGCSEGICKLDSTACIDSDGDSIYTKGTTAGILNGAATTKTDFCESTEKVKEFYCSDNQIKYSIMACPQGKICKDGACVYTTNNLTLNCRDSDGGKEFYSQGTVFVEGSSEGKSDYCQDNYNLVEKYCGEGQLKAYTFKCENGCTLGACNKEEQKVITHEGTYTVRKGTIIQFGEMRAQVNEISWALQGDTAPKVWINGPNAQFCYIHEGEICTLYQGSATEAKPYIKIIANDIEIQKEHPEESEAKISVRFAQATKEEKVTCVFSGDVKERKCYLGGENEKFKCEANAIDENNKSSCTLVVTGKEGTNFTWKSTCGGYGYTIQDGSDETISFGCLKDDEVDEREDYIIKERWFSGAFWECYNGESDKSSSGETCKPYGFWKSSAVHFCKEKCDYGKDKEGYEEKCRVEAFSVSQECYPTNDSISNLNESSEDSSISLLCKDSCPLDGKCYPFGYRKGSKFCSDSGEFAKQFEGEISCENNFECSSNVCVSGNCISQGMAKKVLNWFKRLFGAD